MIVNNSETHISVLAQLVLKKIASGAGPIIGQSHIVLSCPLLTKCYLIGSRQDNRSSLLASVVFSHKWIHLVVKKVTVSLLGPEPTKIVHFCTKLQKCNEKLDEIK